MAIRWANGRVIARIMAGNKYRKSGDSRDDVCLLPTNPDQPIRTSGGHVTCVYFSALTLMKSLLPSLCRGQRLLLDRSPQWERYWHGLVRCSISGKTPNFVSLFRLAYHLGAEKKNKTLSFSHQDRYGSRSASLLCAKYQPVLEILFWKKKSSFFAET